MKKAHEYRQHADECRKLADGLKDGHDKDQLTKMAANWESLARDRDDFIERHPELSKTMSTQDLEPYNK
jgi:hypothetical protein